MMAGSTVAFLVAAIFGGLALFVYGMQLMTTGLEAMAGSGMRGLLSRATGRRTYGLALGAATGFMVHSSAGTVMLVGFLNAGLITLGAAVPPMLGVNIGTTLSMQVVSFRLDQYCFFAIALGLAVRMISPRPAFRNAGLLVFGFGLLFLGMRTMSEAIVPLREAGYFEALLGATDGSTAGGMVLGILVSTAVTAVIQSSGATIGMLFALASAGVFENLASVFPLVLGAHIGTCATALLGSIGTNIEARRLAVSHLLFNVLGATGGALAAPLYLELVPRLGGDLVHQIANAHTAVQVVTAFALLPFCGLYTRLVTIVMPSRHTAEERSHLETRYLDRPEMAIVAVLRETRRMAGISRKMVRRSMEGLLRRDESHFRMVVRAEESVDLLKDTISEYLMQIARRELSIRQSVILQDLLLGVADIERIGDHAEELAEITREKVEQRVWFDDDSMSQLVELYKRLDTVLALTADSLDPCKERFEEGAAAVLRAREEYGTLSRDLHARCVQSVLERRVDAVVGITYSRYLNAFDRIVKHSESIARIELSPLFHLKTRKLDRVATRRPSRPPLPDGGIPVDESLFTDEGGQR